MSNEKSENPLTAPLVRATIEANGQFAKMCTEVEKQCKKGAHEIDVLKVARIAGLEIDEAVLDELQISRTIVAMPWLPVYIWYPWRPLWCWWWRRYHPYYRCCYYWWSRCHWHYYKF